MGCHNAAAACGATHLPRRKCPARRSRTAGRRKPKFLEKGYIPMQVQQMIRASADVLTITTMAAGNVYKRIETRGYGETEPVLRFGVVQSVMNNGEDSAVTALEFTADYSGIAASLKVFDGGKPVAIFPATPDEITQHLGELTERAERDVAAAEDALRGKREALGRVQHLASTVGELTSPSTGGAAEVLA